MSNLKNNPDLFAKISGADTVICYKCGYGVHKEDSCIDTQNELILCPRCEIDPLSQEELAAYVKNHVPKFSKKAAGLVKDPILFEKITDVTDWHICYKCLYAICKEEKCIDPKKKHLVCPYCGTRFKF